VLTLSSSGATATIAQWQTALEAVTYTDTAVTPNNATRTVSFNVDDGLGAAGPSNTATRNVTVADTDQTPEIITTGGTTANYVGGTAAVTVDGSITVADRDNTTQSSATMSVTTGFHSGDTLAFSNTSGTLYGNISASYNSATGVLTLTSSGGTATDAQWANALSAVEFSSSSTSYGARTVAFVTNDGTENSVPATDTVEDIAPPTLTTDSGSAAFTAGDNVASTPVAVDSGITLTDGDSTTASSATVAITGDFHSGEDVLAFTNTDSSTYGNVSASYNATTGVLTLSSSGATATIAQWQTALEAVTYTDTAVTPNNATRTVSFSVTDANSNTSNTATRTVTVADTDQTPVVTTTGGTTSFTIPYGSSPAPVAVDPGITVSDMDNATLPSATITINGSFQAGRDVLGFTNNISTMGNIVGSYNPTTGVLSLSSLGATATLAQWQAALAAVTYTDTAANPSTAARTVVFVVDDGTTSSAPSDKSVSVATASPPVQPSTSIAQHPTSTALSASANPVLTGAQVIYIAIVKPVPDAGTVTFTNGVSPIQGCSDIGINVTSGTATCGTGYASAGGRTVEATYSGDRNYAPSISPSLVEVVTTTLAPGPSSPVPGTACAAAGISTPKAFVCAVYVDLLGRAPAPGEVSGWVHAIEGGTSRAQVAYAILTSPEYRHDLVNNYYQTYLGRTADSSGLPFWVNQLARGSSDEALLAGILASPEYYSTAGGTPAALVTSLYRRLLGRGPAPAELRFWELQLSDGETRAEVAFAFLSSAEYKTKFVERQYSELLARPADPHALSLWVTQLGQGSSDEQVQAAIIGSPEFEAAATK
jgi:hypothetical protein